MPIKKTYKHTHVLDIEISKAEDVLCRVHTLMRATVRASASCETETASYVDLM